MGVRNRPHCTKGTRLISISNVKKLGLGRHSHFEVVKILKARDISRWSTNTSADDRDLNPHLWRLWNPPATVLETIEYTPPPRDSGLPESQSLWGPAEQRQEGHRDL